MDFSKINIALHWNGSSKTVDLSSPIDLSLPLRDPRKGKGPAAWYVGRPHFEPVKEEGFVGSVALGGAVNFTNVNFNPHGHGTHTECLSVRIRVKKVLKRQQQIIKCKDRNPTSPKKQLKI